MIFVAIDELKQKEGSNKTSILNYMESCYGQMLAGHRNLLAEHLNHLKESGELVMVKNSYMRPDPSIPLKCGHGRPPKVKDPVDLSSDAPPVKIPGRGMGRLKKDPNAPLATKKAKPAIAATTLLKTRRPRARSRKVQPQLAQNGVEVN